MSVGFELPEGFRDVIVTHTEIHFCLRDRIRLLFSGVCWLHVETYTENIPGKAISKSAVMAIGGSALTWDGLYLGPPRVKKGIHLETSQRNPDTGNFESVHSGRPGGS